LASTFVPAIFKTAQIAGTKVDAKSLNIGLIFYIL